MRRLKVLAGALVALVAAVLVAVYVVLLQLDLETYRAEIEQRVEAEIGRKLSLEGPMDFSMGLNPRVSVERARLANADWGRHGDMAEIKRFELELALWPLVTGELRANRVVLVEPTIRLERGTDGRGNWELGGEPDDDARASSGAREGKTRRLPTVTSLRIENARVVYREAGREADVQVSLETASAWAKESGRLAIEARGGYQAIPFTLTGEIGDPALVMLGTGVFPIDLALEGPDLRAAVSGELVHRPQGLQPNLRITASGERLKALRPALGPDVPDLESFTIEARLSREEDGYVLHGLNALLGGSDLSGEIRFVPVERPRVTGRLTSAVLDIADFRPEERDELGDAASKQVFPDQPLALEALHAVDGELTLKAGTLRLGRGFDLSAVDARLTLSDGRLALDPLRAELTDGPLSLRTAVDAGQTPAAIAFDLDAERVDYGRLLTAMDITDKVSGTLRARIELRGEGASPRQLASSLDGNVELVGEEGRVADSLLRTAGANVAQVLTPWTESEDDMRLNCVVARFDVSDGVMNSRAILADTEAATLGGDGRISLKDERFDLRVVPEAKHASLMSLAVPMRVTGPLDDPRLGPDMLGAARVGAIAFGTLVNPLATVAALVVESQTRARNPCVTALEKIAEGADGGGADDGGQGGLGGFIEGLGDAIQRQFGGQGEDVEQDDPTILQRRHPHTGP